MASDPMLIITNAGLAAAQVATPTGPYIHITKFRIGSGYGYDATKDDVDINGNLLYEGVPTSYKYIGDNTLNIVCKIPADAGPFDFGEVAVDIEGSVMFAKAVWPTPQRKYSSLGTNVLSTYTFNCLLKLEQSVAVFKIDTLLNEPPAIWEVDFWSDVYPPAVSANPDIPAILVRELDNNGNSTLLHQASDDKWTIGTNYHLYASVPVGGGVVGSVSVDPSHLSGDAVSNTPREFVVCMEDGYMRSVSSVEFSSGFYRFNLVAPLPTPPITGSIVQIYTNRPPIGPTRLVLNGDVRGEAVIAGGTVTLTATVSQTSITGRQQVWDTAGDYDFIVPQDVYDLYLDGCGAGGGGGGAGGGWNQDHVANEDYKAGGGGGGGGNGDSVTGRHLSVLPGQVVHLKIGAKGIGGNGGVAPGGDASNGGIGGDTVITTPTETITLVGGTGGVGGKGYGAPSNNFGAGGEPGQPGGKYGADGGLGGAGGDGGTSPYGSSGFGGRAATIGSVAGGNADGNGAGGGGAGAAYLTTSTVNGSKGGDGGDGLARLSW